MTTPLAHELYDVTVMGSGPAGLTAAIYTCRADLSTVVFEGPLPGGQLTTTTDVENYPGYTDGVMGPELIMGMRGQAERFGAEFHFAEIVSVETDAHPYTVNLADGTSYKTRTLIIASGASPRKLGLESEDALWGFGVSSCATCDGAFFKNKELIVIGGGDSAMEEATFLTRFASKVTIVHRRDTLRASKIMQDRAMNNAKIDFAWNSQVVEILGDKLSGGVTGVILEDTQTGERREVAIDGVFLGIGHIPNSSVFAGQVDMDEEGYILTAPDSTRTNIPGIFAVGDVQDNVFRQAITAAGSGCMGALEAEHYLAGLE